MTSVTEKPLQLPLCEPTRRRRPFSPALGLLSAPAIIWYALFTIGPLIAVFVVATLDWPGIIATPSFIGAKNYQTIFDDPVFWMSVRNTFVQLIIVIPVMIPLAFMTGYYVSMKPRGHRILRIILFTPALLSVAAQAIVFLSIFAPTGLLNGALTNVGLSSLVTPWLASDSTALGTVIAVNLWSGIGFTAILFSARLSAVPGEVYEAAELDGARHWRRMWQIAFPIIKDYFGVLTMLQFLWVLFSSAATILLLTDGGPGNASSTLSFLVYSKAFEQNDLGYSQAVGTLLFVLGVIGMVLIRRLLRARY
ncbi:carbohydrate ABC transporter permease [Lacisediminihabitans sp. H27-G8]|uniref:carbohydrate ABC transporter permease n=1 Tax=Lacisediminihabitans sp. H27-G8 TaxID=3111909 RepID=UPI0038FD2871